VQLDTEYAETAAPTTIVSNYGETHVRHVFLET